MNRLSCHPVKKGFAPFSNVIVFVKRWTGLRPTEPASGIWAHSLGGPGPDGCV